MNCRKTKKLLVDFRQGDLSQKLSDNIRAHLYKCPDCRKEDYLLTASWDMLDAYEAFDPADDFTSSLMKRIRAGTAEKPKASIRLPRFELRYMAPAFASLLIAVLAFIFLWYNRADEKLITENIPPITDKVTDEEVIRDLDLLQNLELLENLQLLGELDMIESEETWI